MTKDDRDWNDSDVDAREGHAESGYRSAAGSGEAVSGGMDSTAGESNNGSPNDAQQNEKSMATGNGHQEEIISQVRKLNCYQEEEEEEEEEEEALEDRKLPPKEQQQTATPASTRHDSSLEPSTHSHSKPKRSHCSPRHRNIHRPKRTLTDSCSTTESQREFLTEIVRYRSGAYDGGLAESSNGSVLIDSNQDYEALVAKKQQEFELKKKPPQAIIAAASNSHDESDGNSSLSYTKQPTQQQLHHGKETSPRRRRAAQRTQTNHSNHSTQREFDAQMERLSDSERKVLTDAVRFRSGAVDNGRTPASNDSVIKSEAASLIGQRGSLIMDDNCTEQDMAFMKQHLAYPRTITSSASLPSDPSVQPTPQPARIQSAPGAVHVAGIGGGRSVSPDSSGFGRSTPDRISEGGESDNDVADPENPSSPQQDTSDEDDHDDAVQFGPPNYLGLIENGNHLVEATLVQSTRRQVGDSEAVVEAKSWSERDIDWMEVARNRKLRIAICSLIFVGTVVCTLVLLGVYGIYSAYEVDETSLGANISEALLSAFGGEIPEITRTALEDPNSPQSKAQAWLLADPSGVQALVPERIIQRFSLATLYYATEGPHSWKDSRDWLNYSQHECQWNHHISGDNQYLQGPTDECNTQVACEDKESDGNGVYVQLCLSDNELGGSVPPELFYLTKLAIIDLSRNRLLTNSIPTLVGHLRDTLRNLNLNSNSLVGTLPTELSKFSALEVLNLSRNRFYGTLPVSMGSALRKVVLEDNRFTGTIPRDWEVFMPQLEVLDLSFNELTGLIPDFMGLGKQTLRHLDLGFNFFHGDIPSELGLLRSLEILQLTGNDFSDSQIPSDLFQTCSNLAVILLASSSIGGSLPTSVGNCQRLTFADFSNNALFSTIPSEIARLQHLEFLMLNANAFTGSIPSTIGLLYNELASLEIGSNRLTSSRIPTEMGMLTRLQVLGLENNKLAGPLPYEIMGLANLERLDLSGNVFNQSLATTEIGRLQTLRSLSLSNSHMHGEIPTEIGLLTRLRLLGLDENSYTQGLPSEVGLLTNLEQLFLNNNRLNSTLPSTLGNLTQLENLYLQQNEFSGRLPSELSLLEDLTVLFVDDTLLTGPVPPTLCAWNGTGRLETFNADCTRVECCQPPN